ncbi:DsbA family protein [Photobacterium iliopiscarium]|jgi:protein-disulfide isomerase|uniref:Disulfide bond formation protein DsbA n=1 Tax=Photobacterium iliopiscarium TaxID=56192 RepID=A0A2T3MRB7_9GAMM|nr:thioredoxin domain-containing protein [Photobacterium iliopiscarium]PST95480.1 disulfide bond formation protein DsbA [Photobacterium iliopiscarium]PSU00277.1 disulfide bond formation protein DsbA [Photobacterium iliopiscarium]PSV84810.1 disulfide bond formation protein DsbA [Photobacterium iliopiscarium]PSV99769.1 disulfide bond formation protein DsbA [Photobacterium iliopiscarium]
MKKLLLPLMLGALLTGCNETTTASNNSDFTAQQKTQIEQIASQYIINHPDVLVKASQTLQQQQMQAQQVEAKKVVIANADQLINDKTTPFIGPKDAKVNVIEFFDYQCMYCSKIADTVKQLEEKNPDVKFIFKETPIFASRWEASKYAADMGNWIYQQKGGATYAKYHNAVFATGKDEGHLTKKDVNTIATSVGVDVSKFDANNTFMNNFELFGKLGFQGTPALIVMPSKNITTDNITIINGYNPDALKKAISDLQASTK